MNAEVEKFSNEMYMKIVNVAKNMTKENFSDSTETIAEFVDMLARIAYEQGRRDGRSDQIVADRNTRLEQISGAHSLFKG